MGREYIVSHRALRQLAVRLSSTGFHVLRFDFYGCGDSYGDFEEWRVLHWLNDISTAISELQRRCSLRKVCLIGLRLGATLAMIAGAERGDVESMVLWDPIISGSSYVKELSMLHQEFLQYYLESWKDRHADDGHCEVLGFPLTASMRADLNKIDLVAIQGKPAQKILEIQSGEKPGAEPLRKHLQGTGAHVEFQRHTDHTPWFGGVFQLLVPAKIIQAVVNWVVEVKS